MSTSTPIDPQNSGSDTPAAPNFELTLRKFWEKNAKIVYLACATVIAVVIVKGSLEFMRAQKQKDIAAAYAAAGTGDRLKSFAAAHPDHLLAGAALLRVADEAYSAGKYTDAAAEYEKAAGIFKTGPFGARAQLGAAVSKIMAGQTVDGEARLKRLADDATQSKTVRAEAAYHLGMIALEAGRNEDAVKAFDLVASLDPSSAWNQRATLHRASLPVSSTSVGVSAQPGS